MTAAAPASTLAALDPADLSPSQWAAKLAAFSSRGRADDDPDVLACRAALSFWRCRRTLDAEVAQLGPGGAEALISRIRTGATAVVQ
jgi:hypothetical protein